MPRRVENPPPGTPRRIAALACGFCALALSGNAQAQAMHYGYDSRRISADECLSRAAQSLTARGYDVSGDTRAVFGAGRRSFVLVYCTPLAAGTDILVVAAGDNAERERNEVRVDVMGLQ